jgi:hypothetical protein
MANVNGIDYKDAKILDVITETKTVKYQIKKDAPKVAKVADNVAPFFKKIKTGEARIGIREDGALTYIKNVDATQKTFASDSVQIPKQKESTLAMPMSISESSAIDAPIKKSSSNKKLYAFKFALEFVKLSGQKPQSIEEIKKIASEIELCI